MECKLRQILRDQRHETRVMRIHGSDEAPVAGPGVHFDFGETRPDAFVGAASFPARDAPASRALAVEP